MVGQLGDEAEVVEVIPGKYSCARIEDMGFRSEKMVEMLNNERKESLLIRVDESRIDLGRGMVMKIILRRIEERIYLY
jgi:Fe2+ transport system protein FeoA